MVKTKKLLNRNQIKVIAIVLMFLDHITCFLQPDSFLYTAICVLSRLTAPTMAYFIAEGYRHTRDPKKYVLRLLLFALISWPAFVFYHFGSPRLILLSEGNMAGLGYIQASVYLAALGKSLVIRPFSVISTLFFCLLAVMAADSRRLRPAVKFPTVLLLVWAGQFGDWSWILVAYTLIFFFFAHDRRKMWLAYCVPSLFYCFGVCQYNPLFPALGTSFSLTRFGVFLVIPFLELLYNGQPGKKSTFNQYFFYLFYPLHLILIGLVKWYLV